MEFLKDIVPWFLAAWFITIPLTLWIIYTVVTELLDLIFNTGRINEQLKGSDNFDIEPLKKEFEQQKLRQFNLSFSNLQEVKRQVDFTKLHSKRDGWVNSLSSQDKEKIAKAKMLSDIFSIQK
jgi:hypothetical protein